MRVDMEAIGEVRGGEITPAVFAFAIVAIIGEEDVAASGGLPAARVGGVLASPLPTGSLNVVTLCGVARDSSGAGGFAGWAAEEAFSDAGWGSTAIAKCTGRANGTPTSTVMSLLGVVLVTMTLLPAAPKATSDGGACCEGGGTL